MLNRGAHVSFIKYFVLFSQVDKGVVPLPGTNGETTTQGILRCPISGSEYLLIQFISLLIQFLGSESF